MGSYNALTFTAIKLFYAIANYPVFSEELLVLCPACEYYINAAVTVKMCKSFENVL